jgi:hypothetical protein
MRAGACMMLVALSSLAAPEFSDEEEELEEGSSEEDSGMEGIRFNTGAPSPDAAPGPLQTESPPSIFCAPPPPAYVRPPPAATDDNLTARPVEGWVIATDCVPGLSLQ